MCTVSTNPCSTPPLLPAVITHALIVMKASEYAKITSLIALSSPGSGGLGLNADMTWSGTH